MPMGTTSYLLRSMALRMEAAESSETSCSPERPPKRMPMRSFFFMDAASRLRQAPVEAAERQLRRTGGVPLAVGIRGRGGNPRSRKKHLIKCNPRVVVPEVGERDGLRPTPKPARARRRGSNPGITLFCLPGVAGQEESMALALRWCGPVAAGLALVTLACGSNQHHADTPAPAPAMKPAPPTPIDIKRAETGGPMWDPAWDTIVEEVLPPEMLSAQVARDVRPFCPRFISLGDADKRAFWAYFF